jgi:hypothetical protein
VTVHLPSPPKLIPVVDAWTLSRVQDPLDLINAAWEWGGMSGFKGHPASDLGSCGL